MQKYVYKLVQQKDIVDIFDIYLIDKENDCAQCVVQESITTENNSYQKDLKEVINKNIGDLSKAKKVFTFSGELFDVKEICKAANHTYELVALAKKENSYQERKPFSIESEKIGFLSKFKIGKDLFKVCGFGNTVFETENYADASKICNFLNKIWIAGEADAQPQ